MNEKYLIIRPKYGLCNQLISISKGIIFSHITKRNLIFIGFQIDYRDENNIVNFNEIIDVDNLQKIINSFDFNINIINDDSIDSIKIKKSSNENISYIKDFIPLLTNSDNKDIKYLDVDNPISADIPEKYNDILKYININIKFTKKYNDVANSIKIHLKLKNYSCIHLRLEDDAINFMKDHNKKIDISIINEIYKKKYINELEYLKNINHNIYICTSLCINDNINNQFYIDIKKKYNLFDKNDFINNQDFGQYREIFGIIDYIIAKDSIYFIGADWSSFSMFIYDHHYHNKIASKLIDIYNTVVSL